MAVQTGLCRTWSETPKTVFLRNEAHFIVEKLNGDQCLADMECLVTGAVCDGATGTCSCPAAMYLDGMTCKNSKCSFWDSQV